MINLFQNIFKLKENQNSTELRGIIGQLKLNNNILNVNDFVVDNSSSIYNLVLHNLSSMYKVSF